MFASSRRSRRRGDLFDVGRRRLRGRGHPLRAAALRALNRAHRRLRQGAPAEAAPIFAELAASAENYEMPARAAQLHLQAARSQGLAGDRAGVLQPALRAVSLLARVGEVALLSTALPRFIDELRAQGFSAEAGEVERAVAAALGAVPAPAAAPGPAAARYALLPSECPQCAGPVRPDEVEWIDDRTAVCGYCGSTLHGT